jgi:glycosyltransferase 2 family protein
VNWAALGAVFAQLDVRWTALAWASTICLIGSLAWRWRLFLQQQNITLPYRTVFSLTWAGQFFNSLLPGSTGGDAFKIYQICRLAPDRKAAAASTVLLDRLSALVALLCLAVGSILLDPTPLLRLPPPDVPASRLVALGLLLGAGGMIGLWLLSRLLRHTKLHGRISRTLVAAREAVRFDRTFLFGLLLAFAIHLLNFLIIYFFARALRIPLSYPQIAMMMSAVLLFLMLPVTINGHGLRELLLIGYLSYLGAVVAGPVAVDARETAVALSLLAVTTDLLLSIPGGLLYLFRFRTSAAPPDHA